MDYLQNSCFAGVNSKRIDFQQERKEKKTSIAAVSVAIEFVGPRQMSKQMARKLCRNNIFYVATQDLEIGI